MVLPARIPVSSNHEGTLNMARKKATRKPAKKRKPSRKPSRKTPRKTKAASRAGNKKNKKRTRSRPARSFETTSGSAGSSLDPRRAGKLTLRDVRRGAKERRIGDLQGISMEDRADSESVGELLEEGQALEAEAVQGVENAPDADQGEVRTRQPREDDVPEEYLDRD
jgi:hypothetical protein